jgi:hypothetical protein
MPAHDASGCANRRLAVFGRRRPEAAWGTAHVLGLCHRERRSPSRLEHVRSRADRARHAVRRMVLHGRVDHTGLLPPHVSGKACQVAQRRLLPHRGRSRARGFPAVFAVSTRDRARDTRVARRCDDGLACAEAHRARILRRWQDRRGPRGHARHDVPTSATTVRAARRRLTDSRRDDPTRATRKNAGRRDHDADVHDRVHRGVRQHPTIQRRVSRGVSEAPNRPSPSEARAWVGAERRPGQMTHSQTSDSCPSAHFHIN